MTAAELKQKRELLLQKIRKNEEKLVFYAKLQAAIDVIWMLIIGAFLVRIALVQLNIV